VDELGYKNISFNPKEILRSTDKETNNAELSLNQKTINVESMTT
jgi:hypothetical protein